jgi:hypothetical protein
MYMLHHKFQIIARLSPPVFFCQEGDIQTDRRTDFADRWEIREDATVIYHVLSSVGTNRSVGSVASLSRHPGASSVTVRGCSHRCYCCCSWDGQDLFTYAWLALQWRFLALYSICPSLNFRSAVLSDSAYRLFTEWKRGKEIYENFV